MSKKVYAVANDDLENVSFSLEKIRAAAQSAHSYLDHMICKPSEDTNAVLCMFRVIEDLTNTTNDQLSAAIDKLCTICREAEVSA